MVAGGCSQLLISTILRRSHSLSVVHLSSYVLHSAFSSNWSMWPCRADVASHHLIYGKNICTYRTPVCCSSLNSSSHFVRQKRVSCTVIEWTVDIWVEIHIISSYLCAHAWWYPCTVQKGCWGHIFIWWACRFYTILHCLIWYVMSKYQYVSTLFLRRCNESSNDIKCVLYFKRTKNKRIQREAIFRIFIAIVSRDTRRPGIALTGAHIRSQKHTYIQHASKSIIRVSDRRHWSDCGSHKNDNSWATMEPTAAATVALIVSKLYIPIRTTPLYPAVDDIQPDWKIYHSTTKTVYFSLQNGLNWRCVANIFVRLSRSEATFLCA